MTLQFDPNEDFAEQVRAVMTATLDALRDCPSEGNYWLLHFPRESCELASWVLGSMLLELEYGDWTLVSGMIDSEGGYTDRRGSHVWLELRQGDEVLFSVDATADQFPEWASHPFVASGASSLARYFRDSRRWNLISQPLEWHLDKFHQPPLEYVRSVLLDDQQDIPDDEVQAA